MKTLTRHHQALLETWQQHTHAEFLLKDPDAALATMTEHPYVICVPCGLAAVGRAAVREFYADEFLPCIPPDFELESLSQTFGGERMIEEFLVRFTHTLKMSWMVPEVPATGRRVEVPLVAIIRFKGAKVACEHIYWDQATVLSQLGLLDQPAATGGARSAAQLRNLSAPSVDELAWTSFARSANARPARRQSG